MLAHATFAHPRSPNWDHSSTMLGRTKNMFSFYVARHFSVRNLAQLRNVEWLISYPTLFTYLPPMSTGAMDEERGSTAQEDLVAFVQSLPSLRSLTIGISEERDCHVGFFAEAREGAEDVTSLLCMVEHLQSINNRLPVLARRKMDWDSWGKPMCILLLAAESGMCRNDEWDGVSVDNNGDIQDGAGANARPRGAGSEGGSHRFQNDSYYLLVVPRMFRHTPITGP